MKQLLLTTFTIISFLTISLNGFSQTLFQKTYGYPKNDYAGSGQTSGVIETRMEHFIKLNDNRFLLVGSGAPTDTVTGAPLIAQEGQISCVDSLGQLVWTKTYGDYDTKNRDEKFTFGKLCKNGEVLVAGFEQPDPGISPGIYQNCYLIRINASNGNLIWSKSFGTDNYYDYIYSLSEDTDGNIYTLGTSNKTSGTYDFRSFVAKLDASGNLLWRKFYTLPNNTTDAPWFSSSVVLSGGELLIGGYASINNNGFNNATILLKLDTSGNVVWSNKYLSDEPKSSLLSQNIVQLSNNEFFLYGIANNKYAGVMKIDSSGSILWTKKTDDKLSPKGAYGHSKGLIISQDKQHLYMIGELSLSKITINGESMLWARQYGGCQTEQLGDVVEGANSTLYFAGWTKSYGQSFQWNWSTGYFVRTDTAGYSSCFQDDMITGLSDFPQVKSSQAFNVSNDNVSAVDYSITVGRYNLFDSLICSSQNPEKIEFKAKDTLLTCPGMCTDFIDLSITDLSLSTSDIWFYPSPTADSTDLIWIPTKKYKWLFPGATPNSGTDTLPNPTNVCYNTEGKFDVTMILTHGCKIDTVFLKDYIHVTSTPVLAITGDSNFCDGGIAQLVVSGAKDYSWSPTAGIDKPTNDTIIASPSTTTTYTVTGTAGVSCTATKTVTVTVGSPVTADAGTNDTICLGESATLTGAGGQTFTWSSNQTTRTISVSPTTTTDYIFTAIDGDCKDADTVEVVVNDAPAVTLTNDSQVAQGESVSIEATGGGTYQWSPFTSLSCTDCASPTATPDQTTNYCVTVTSENGCKTEKCVNITIKYNCGEVFVPNSFSPNGDGNNDQLEVKVNANCVQEYSFQVFDRWGELVFMTEKITESWDGKYKGKELDNAVFVYHLKTKLVDGTIIDKKGNVSIIK